MTHDPFLHSPQLQNINAQFRDHPLSCATDAFYQYKMDS